MCLFRIMGCGALLPGGVIPDPRLLVCCMVDWGKGRCLPFFKFFPVLGENKLFLEKRNRIGLNRKFSVSLQDNDMHKP